jgi:predicted Fe-Mo cluster-binding NifX family protein
VIAVKVALAIWGERVSPVFDVSREVVLVTIRNGVLGPRRRERLEVPTDELRVERLTALGIDTLVCGAISARLQRAIASRRVRVISFVAGDARDVLQALAAGALPAREFTMPGCEAPLRPSRRRARFTGRGERSGRSHRPSPARTLRRGDRRAYRPTARSESGAR